MASPDHRIKSVSTVFRIVETLDRGGQMGVTEIAQATGISKSVVYKYLDSLRHAGYVRKSDGHYELSLRWFELGRRVRDRQAVVQVARSELDQLARQTGETVSLVVEENGDAVYVYQVADGETTVAPVDDGARIPALVSVGGKAIFSYRPAQEVQAILAKNDLEAQSQAIVEELDSVRNQRIVIERGNPQQGPFSAGSFEGHRHVVDHEEPYRDLHSIAVPIRNPDAYAVAAIEVSGAESSLYGRRLEEDIAELLVKAGKTIETALLQHTDERV